MQVFNQALSFMNSHRVTTAWGAVAGTYLMSCAIKGRINTNAAIKALWNGELQCQKNHPYLSKIVKWGAVAVALSASAYYGDWKGVIQSLWNRAFPKSEMLATRVPVLPNPPVTQNPNAVEVTVSKAPPTPSGNVSTGTTATKPAPQAKSPKAAHAKPANPAPAAVDATTSVTIETGAQAAAPVASLAATAPVAPLALTDLPASVEAAAPAALATALLVADVMAPTTVESAVAAALAASEQLPAEEIAS